jgi:hypothetical protein
MPAEKRRAVNRIDDPDPIRLTELTELLAEERVFRPRRGHRLAKQPLHCPVGLVTGVPSAFSVADTPDSK